MVRFLLQLLAVVSGTYVCLSEEINCTSLETSNGTFYIVSHHIDSNCDYSWTNQSGYVLANNIERIDEMIISSNNTFLHTYSCHEIISYSCDCMSTKYTTAKCYVNCTRSAGLPRVAENPPKLLIPVIASVLLVILVIICFVCRDRFCRWRQHRYTTGKPNNPNQVKQVLAV